MRLTIAFIAVNVLFCQSAAGQTLFEFHSGFWLNLHQFLCSEQAAGASGATEWQSAIEYYKREIIPRDLLSDEAAAVNFSLSLAGSEPALAVNGLDPELAAVLSKAAPLYRRLVWPGHDRTNRAWIASLEPLLARYGAPMSRELAAVWQTQWPRVPIRVDVSAYAGTNGAYTTLDPAHITITSTDASYQGDAALEMLFHEASHTLDGNMRAALTAELKRQNRLLHRRTFSHAILFYTAGEIAKRYLSDYEPYAIRNGVLERGWPGSVTILEKDWKPYLQGRTTLAEALAAIVTDYGEPKPAR